MTYIQQLKDKLISNNLSPQQNDTISSVEQLMRFNEQKAKNVNPNENFLLNFGTNLLSSPANEGTMASLGKAMQSGVQGANSAVNEIKEHMGQAISLKEMIANTYKSVEDIMFKKQQHYDSMALKKEMLGLKRHDSVVNSNRDLIKQNTKNIDVYSQKLRDEEQDLNDLNGIEERLKKLNDFGVLSGKVANFSPLGGEFVGVGKQGDIQNLIQDLETYVIKSSKKMGGSRMTNAILKQVKDSKMNLGMGKEAVADIVKKLKLANELDIKYNKFIRSAMQKGYDEFKAKEAFNYYSENPDKIDPWELLNDLSSIED